MQCVILAGGLGTRMRPWTAQLPKTLIPVAGQPFAHVQLAWLARHGVTEVVYCIAVKGDMVRDAVGDGSRWGLRIRYVEDGQELLGTAGALRRALDAGRLAEWFLLLYGDSFLPFDYRRLATAFRAQRRSAMMAVYHNQGQLDTGNVQFAEGVVQLYRKARAGENPLEMPYIDYGISALRTSLIEEQVPARQVCDLAAIYHRLSLEGQLAGFEVGQRFYEIGSPAGLGDFENWLQQHPVQTWANP